jgi:hypothetical protein
MLAQDNQLFIISASCWRPDHGSDSGRDTPPCHPALRMNHQAFANRRAACFAFMVQGGVSASVTASPANPAVRDVSP